MNESGQEQGPLQCHKTLSAYLRKSDDNERFEMRMRSAPCIGARCTKWNVVTGNCNEVLADQAAAMVYGQLKAWMDEGEREVQEERAEAPAAIGPLDQTWPKG